MKVKLKQLKPLLNNTSEQNYNLLLTTDTNTANWENLLEFIFLPEDFTINFMSDYYLDSIILGDINGYRGHALDLEYIAKHGERYIVGDFESLTDALAYVQTVAEMTLVRKGADLQRLFYTLFEKYNPIYNKDVTETKTVSGTMNQKTVNGVLAQDAHTGTITDATTGDVEGITESTSSGKPNGDALTDHKTTETYKRVPYNGDSEVEADATETKTEVQKTVHDRTNNVDYSNTRTFLDTNAKTANYTDTDSANYTESTIAQGNQGITMSQEMISAEYDLRMKKSFWSFVYDLCLSDITYLLEFGGC